MYEGPFSELYGNAVLSNLHYEGVVPELYGEAQFSYHHYEGDVTALHGDALFSVAMATAVCIDTSKAGH